MTDEQIKELYDQEWNLTLRELSEITGKQVDELKRILLEEQS